jgi:transcriptional regulator with XRE-family HTH domain
MRHVTDANHMPGRGVAPATLPFSKATKGNAEPPSHLFVGQLKARHVLAQGHAPRMGTSRPPVKGKVGSAPKSDIAYRNVPMGNGLRAARVRAKMTLQQAADALGLSLSGYGKKERGSRGLKGDFIRRACEVFGVTPEAIMRETAVVSFAQDIDPGKLATLIILARERLGSLPEAEAKQLLLALISASRRPQGQSPSPGDDEAAAQ